jgi:hypothetical protein
MTHCFLSPAANLAENAQKYQICCGVLPSNATNNLWVLDLIAIYLLEYSPGGTTVSRFIILQHINFHLTLLSGVFFTLHWTDFYSQLMFHCRLIWPFTDEPSTGTPSGSELIWNWTVPDITRVALYNLLTDHAHKTQLYCWLTPTAHKTFHVVPIFASRLTAIEMSLPLRCVARVAARTSQKTVPLLRFVYRAVA